MERPTSTDSIYVPTYLPPGTSSFPTAPNPARDICLVTHIMQYNRRVHGVLPNHSDWILYSSKHPLQEDRQIKALIFVRRQTIQSPYLNMPDRWYYALYIYRMQHCKIKVKQTNK